MAHDSDQRGQFLTDAAINVINEQSIRVLKEAVDKKYSNDPQSLKTIYFGPETFRMNILIDELNESSFCEDEF